MQLLCFLIATKRIKFVEKRDYAVAILEDFDQKRF